MKLSYLFLLILATFFTSCNKPDPKQNIVVQIQYKTLQNKNVEAIVALKTLIDKVKREDHFVKINLYVDPNDNSNILLSEEWENENYYRNEHMKTEHLQSFTTESAAFLAQAPQTSYWKLHSTFD